MRLASNQRMELPAARTGGGASREAAEAEAEVPAEIPESTCTEGTPAAAVTTVLLMMVAPVLMVEAVQDVAEAEPQGWGPKRRC